jgi:hypothetical protein
MFDKPTLLILGAGSSLDMGYPLGEDLIKEIIEQKDEILKSYLENFKDSGWDPHREFISFLFLKKRTSPAETPRLPTENEIYKERDRLLENTRGCPQKAATLYNIAHAIPFFSKLKTFQPLSIDRFLAVHQDFKDIGKFAITYIITRREEQYQDVCLQGTPRFINGKQITQTLWHRYLIDNILSGCEEDPKNIKDNKLSIITFNYDVSLEAFLYSRLYDMEHFDYEENNEKKNYANEFLDNLKIHHVYGRVREGESNLIRDYGDKFQPKQLDQIKTNIHVIGEERKDKDQAYQIINSFSREGYVYIMGYDFDNTNNNKIALSKLFSYSRIADRSLTHNSWEVSLERKVFCINFKNSQIINNIIKNMVGDDISNISNIIQNLQISEKPIAEAVGQDFSFKETHIANKI